MNRKKPHPRVNGTRVLLRYPEPSDAQEFIALNRASRRFHSGLVSPPLDRESYLSYILRNENESNECFLICLKQDGEIAGAINLSQIFRGSFQNAYLGYFVGEAYAGKGLMNEAVGLVLRYAFRDLKLHRVESNVQPHNAASIAVLRRNGFAKEGFSRKYLKIRGRWRDHERWAIIAEDWKKIKG